jgi:aspartate carbamoyltransferase regulatory subunit
MNIDSITTGIVIDHIRAGKSMEIYRHLRLDTLNCSVAIIKNVKSTKMCRKDIIKIDAEMEINLDVLGYIDPGITVNIIKDGKVIKKKQLELPKKLINVIKCKNPRCITTVENEIDQIFVLIDGDKEVYRCMYCETASSN